MQQPHSASLRGLRGSLTDNGQFTFTYNNAGRLISLTRAQGITATQVYTYNGDPLRFAPRAGGLLMNRNITRYVWDQAADLPQMLSDGSTLYVPGVGQWNGTTWAYELTDGLGSVRQLSDAQGNIVQRYEYSPFGEVLAAEGQRSSALQYTGEQSDIDTGLIYLRARWYDSATGRFTTRDPFPGFAALPQTLHPYVYVNNNPVNLTDPSGKIAPVIIAIALGMLIGGGAGGIIFAITHPCTDLLRSSDFWQSILVGALSGSVAGFVGWALPWLLPSATGFWSAVGIGMISGSAAGGAGQVTSNLLLGKPWHQDVGQAILLGGAIGGIGGGVGWKVRQWISARTGISWSKPHGVSEHWEAIQQEVERMTASGKYSKIFVNKALSTATEGQVQSGLRPDIIAQTPGGKYFIVEVVSPSQSYAQIQAKMQQLQQLLGTSFSGGKIIQP